jgi:hypothetical protein
MTPEQIEDLIERTALRTAGKIREDVRGMFTALGFDMDPDHMHEEQQMVGFLRRMHQGTQTGKKAGVTAFVTTLVTALVGWVIYYFGLFKTHT